MAGDPYWSSVVLAMHMDGANASTAFVDQKGKVVTAVGNAQISTAQSKFGGASGYFDGTGDSLTTPNSADFQFGAGDFSIEAFVRFAILPTAGTNVVFVSRYLSAGNMRSFLFYMNNTGGVYTLKLWASSDGTGTATISSAPATPSVNTWHHFAVCRKDGIVYLFQDGVLVGQANNPTNLWVGTAQLALGSTDGVTDFLTGYIDDLRITKGVARYTANFTPPVLAFPDTPAMISGTVKDSTNAFVPRAVRAYRKSDGAFSGAVTSHSTTGAFAIPALDASSHFAIAHDSDADPYWNNVVLATHFDTDSVVDPYMSSVVLGLHMEGADASTVFQDVTGKTVTAVGNAKISMAQSKFGGASGYFDGAGDYLSVPDSADWNLTATHTVEAWVRIAAFPTIGVMSTIFSRWDGPSNKRSSLLGIFNNAGVYTLRAYYSADGVNAVIFDSASISFALNTWYHVAFSSDGTNIRIFLNGMLSGSVQANTTIPFASATAAYVGAFSVIPAWFLTGYIDDLRITKGVARYTANFTPPTVPFSSFKDLTGKDLMVNGVPSISTGTKKYGDGAVYFDGAGDYLDTPNVVDLRFAGGDFTVEAWVNAASVTQFQPVVGQAEDAISGWVVDVNSSGYPRLIAYVGSWQVILTSSVAVIINTWTHIAVVRYGASFTLYVDGVARAAASSATAMTDCTAIKARVGYFAATGGARYFIGYIDDLRITKGVARYQTNFTPPERAFVGAMTAGTENAVIFDDLAPV